MDYNTVMEYLRSYGAVAIMVIVFLEYMNLPGFPAGVIMPLAGVWASHGEIGFFTVMVITIIAGLAGSWVTYFLGYFIGGPLLEKWQEKFPKQKPVIEKAMNYVQQRGYWGLFVGKLIPMLRTLIPIPAGVLRMKFSGYTLYSLFGIAIWNFVYVGAGYYLGELILPYIRG